MRVWGSSWAIRQMKKIGGVLVLACSVSSNSLAGSITLTSDPAPVTPGETVDIYVDVATEELPALHRVMVRLGSPDLMIGATDDFAFDAAFLSVAPITVTSFLNPTIPDTWQNGIVAAGSAFLDDIIPPFRLGTLTVTVPTMPFVIEAWGEVEMEWQGDWLSEDLGTAFIVFPEPSTAVMLLGGLLGLSLSRYRSPREQS
jgi:hypothetical protein